MFYWAVLHFTTLLRVDEGPGFKPGLYTFCFIHSLQSFWAEREGMDERSDRRTVVWSRLTSFGRRKQLWKHDDVNYDFYEKIKIVGKVLYMRNTVFVLVKRLSTWDTLCHLGGLLAKTLRPGMYLWGCVLRRTKIKRCSVASVVVLFFKRNVEGFHILVDIVDNQGRSNNCSASVRTQMGVRAG